MPIRQCSDFDRVFTHKGGLCCYCTGVASICIKNSIAR